MPFLLASCCGLFRLIGWCWDFCFLKETWFLKFCGIGVGSGCSLRPCEVAVGSFIGIPGISVREVRFDG